MNVRNAFWFGCFLLLTAVVNIAGAQVNSSFLSNGSDRDSTVLLIQINPDQSALFRRQHQNSIVRQLSPQLFVIKQNELQDTAGAVIYHISYNWKLSPRLLQVKDRLLSNRFYTFLVQVKDVNAFVKSVQHGELKVVQVNEKAGVCQVETSAGALHYLLHNNNILFVDVKNEAPKEEMVINDYDNSVNSINLFFSRYPDVTGNGVTVSVKENLFDTSDIDFTNRYLPTNNISSEVTTHATTMATLIAGGGNSYYTGKGIAPAARVASSDFANLLPDSDVSYAGNNITVQNHSYGTQVENFYGADAAAFDAALLTHPNLVYVFSAGNSGSFTDSTGVYRNVNGFANLTGSFKQAKNVITVGSVDSFYQIPVASSKGPAYDGRIKPELVAYGNDGSSGAAAIASGTTLAVQSAYAGQHHDSLPPNTLVKAILLNSADDVFHAGPDYYSGYGNVNTYAAVRDVLSGAFFSGIATAGSRDRFRISVPAGVKEVKLMLVWNDVPAAANAFTALENDLDLSLQKNSDGTMYLPWVLDAAPDSARLLSAPRRSRDSLNVVEQITISQPAAGDYTISVSGYQLSSGNQPYSVVYEMNAADRFQFTTPAEGENIIAKSKGMIRWQDTHREATGKLEYSFDRGTSWKLITAAAPLAGKYATWQVPDTSAPALMRMTIGENVFTSDTFQISQQLQPQVLIACGDSAVITWNRLKGIDSYLVSQLGDAYLQPYTVVTDTSAVIKTPASPYFAVTPLLADGRKGLTSYAFNYNTQGAGCYINNFLADLNENNGADLSLSLGTITGVDSILFQHQVRGSWQTIQTFHSVNNTDLTYTDSSLLNGINPFRAVVWVQGKAVVSTTADVLFFKQADFIVKPNPVRQGQNLSILWSTLTNGTLVLYDMWGRKREQQEIKNEITTIQTNTLSKGIYFLVIYDGKQSVFTRKVLIE